MASRNGAHNTTTRGGMLLAIHDFIARSVDELSLAKGDRIELIERDDDFGDGWFLGRHLGNGGTGLFPEVYTTPAPKGTLNAAAPQPRRASEGPLKSAGSGSDASTTPASPTQPRHLSGPVGQSTLASAAIPPSPTMPTAIRTSLPAASPSMNARTHTFNADSPVMSETLSVINEHITDMNTPRSSFHNGAKRDTMGSVYSQPLSRLSYIPGHETDEDENLHTEEEVMAWSPLRVAEYLEDHQVEKQHCEVFKDQEISGEVLLAMDQSSLFIKEFDLGSVGRRLKTWHKIKALQDEVRRSSPDVSRSVISDHSTTAGALADDASVISEPNRNRSSTMGTSSFLPRGLEPRQSMDGGRSNTLQPSSSIMSFGSQQSAPSPSVSRAPSSAMSPLQSMTSLSRPENTYRPSAQKIRQMQNARRHSSIDSASSAGASRTSMTGHRKQPSIDKKWQPGQAMSQAVNSKPGHSHTMSADAPEPVSGSPGEFDRGYFSDSPTAPQVRKGNVLTKKASSASTSAMASPLQSRANSFVFSNNRSGGQTTRRTSFGNRDPTVPLINAGASTHMVNALNAVQSKFGGARSATMPQLNADTPPPKPQPAMSPVVTKLEYPTNGTNKPLDAVAAASTSTTDVSSAATPSPSSTQLGFFASQKQKITGLHSSSEAVTKVEKGTAEVPASIPEGPKALASPTRTGSTTPSTETRSFDLQKSLDGQSRRTSTASGGKSMAQQGLVPPQTSTKRARPKTKKATSAYTRGLEKITPADQLKRGADYSGWMKKKSGSLMSTWKPRLFILKGRRLSYYYSEKDTEEKGLIDISFHRVLPAHNETLTGLHAAVTGAGASPTSPTHATSTQAELDLKANPPKPGDKSGDNAGLFIFKLVPPKSGLAKGVSFTKPTVHYFAVNSRQEGRLWMAALMKATIDRDEDGVVTTTYSQKTISLAKAKARRERPPALQEEGMEGRAELGGAGGESDEEPGLGIGGLSGDSGSVTPATPSLPPVVANGKELVGDMEGVGVGGDGGGALLAPGVTAAGVMAGRISEEKQVVSGAA
ncbi:polar growth protein [Teratosphaeriaceae sp. CCFEE 6253]|nr:polar growth protein [Teratosphaeriaceae sp. CCFEE 6253]